MNIENSFMPNWCEKGNFKRLTEPLITMITLSLQKRNHINWWHKASSLCQPIRLSFVKPLNMQPDSVPIKIKENTYHPRYLKTGRVNNRWEYNNNLWWNNLLLKQNSNNIRITQLSLQKMQVKSWITVQIIKWTLLETTSHKNHRNIEFELKTMKGLEELLV